MEHMGEKLLKGEQAPNQSAQRHRFDALLLKPNLQTVLRGIHLQDDMMTDELGGDGVAFEVNADHAMAIHFALQVQPIELREPAIRIHRDWQGG